jgi:uncharacterized protein (TIGR02996 family)
VLAITHPDATAFAARFLANPTDRLGRLVFADWLDEQGGESNTAWARYLRYMAHAEEEPDSDCVRQAEILGRTVRARLTLSGVPGKSLLPWLRAFLPPHRLLVRIGTTTIPREVLVNCPEVISRLYRFVPFDVLPTDHLFGVVAADRIEHLGLLHQDMENFLSFRLTAFIGDQDDVSEAIDRHFGRNRRVIENGVIVQD